MIPFINDTYYYQIIPESIFNYFKFVSFFYLLLLLIKSKKRASILLIIVVIMDSWWLLSNYLNYRFSNLVSYYKMIEKIISELSLALLIENFRDRPKTLIKGLMPNYEFAVYLNYFVSKVMPIPVRNEYFLGYYNILVLWILPAITISLLYICLFKKRIRSAFLIIVSVMTVIKIWSATTLVAVAALFGVLVLTHFIDKYNLKKISLTISMLFSFAFNILCLVFYSSGGIPILNVLIEQILNRSASMTRRDVIWKKAYSMFLESPIFGYGYKPKIYFSESTVVPHAHNMILQELITMGIVGLLLFIAFHYFLSREVDKANNSMERNIVIASIVGISFTYITEVYMRSYSFYIVFFIAYYINEIVERSKLEDDSQLLIMDASENKEKIINIAIIGASYLQLPLIKKAKKMGYVTHVFAWKANDVGEYEADFFYPISIVEKDQILEKCREIGIDGICSIASDLGIITVNYVAQNLGLISNDLECTSKSTNKHLMRECFEENGDPSPKSVLVKSINDLKGIDLEYPLIVKPLDRSGSRGITKVFDYNELEDAIIKAEAEGFEKSALIEEFAEGNEYSVESISWEGSHTVLAITKKYTTGSPNFVETGHLEPSDVSDEIADRVIEITKHALDSLGIKYGASHTELKIDEEGNIKLIEIGGRMGGDMIGSDLVRLTTGYDFVKAVIDVSLGKKPEEFIDVKRENAAVKFIFSKKDLNLFNKTKQKKRIEIVDYQIEDNLNDVVTDSSNRHGYFIMISSYRKSLENILKR